MKTICDSDNELSRVPEAEAVGENGSHQERRNLTTQDPIQAESDEDPVDRSCTGCGGPALYKDTFHFGFREGHSVNGWYHWYECIVCRKSHAELAQIGGPKEHFQPSALEAFVLWEHDEGIHWVDGDDSDEPTEYSLAREGFIAWTEYERASGRGYVDDPGWSRYIEAHEGKRRWDELMAKWGARDIEQIADPYGVGLLT